MAQLGLRRYLGVVEIAGSNPVTPIFELDRGGPILGSRERWFSRPTLLIFNRCETGGIPFFSIIILYCEERENPVTPIFLR